MAIDLEDAYNRVQFKLLMDLLRQYGVSLILTQWIAGELLVMQLGNWSSAHKAYHSCQSSTMCTPRDWQI